MGGKRIDIESEIGKKYGRWTIKEFVGRDNQRRAKFLCECICGNKREVRHPELKRGKTRSCGCLQKEVVSETAKFHITHGSSYSRLYKIWESMKTRCYNEKAVNYERYGGRGIGVCAEWLRDFKNFKEWAYKNGYNDTLTLDRINTNQGYSPNNCRWATITEQARNRRNTWLITIDGITKSAAEWCLIYNISYDTAWARKKNYGWNDVDCVTIPKNHRRKANK